MIKIRHFPPRGAQLRSCTIQKAQIYFQSHSIPVGHNSNSDFAIRGALFFKCRRNLVTLFQSYDPIIDKNENKIGIENGIQNDQNDPFEMQKGNLWCSLGFLKITTQLWVTSVQCSRPLVIHLAHLQVLNRDWNLIKLIIENIRLSACLNLAKLLIAPICQQNLNFPAIFSIQGVTAHNTKSGYCKSNISYQFSLFGGQF